MQKPEEGKDYYFENGLMVMTAYYLLRRGYCCGNRCRHCPYNEKGNKKNENPKPKSTER